MSCPAGCGYWDHQGPQSQQGQQGPQDPQGPQGPQGQQGHLGQQGPQGQGLSPALGILTAAAFPTISVI